MSCLCPFAKLLFISLTCCQFAVQFFLLLLARTISTPALTEKEGKKGGKRGKNREKEGKRGKKRDKEGKEGKRGIKRDKKEG